MKYLLTSNPRYKHGDTVVFGTTLNQPSVDEGGLISHYAHLYAQFASSISTAYSLITGVAKVKLAA